VVCVVEQGPCNDWASVILLTAAAAAIGFAAECPACRRYWSTAVGAMQSVLSTKCRLRVDRGGWTLTSCYRAFSPKTLRALNNDIKWAAELQCIVTTKPVCAVERWLTNIVLRFCWQTDEMTMYSCWSCMHYQFLCVFNYHVQPAINVLLSVIKDSESTSAAKSARKKRANASILQRPIICICNDLYVPSLRHLRQSAFLVTFYGTSSIALSARLLEV